MAYGLQFFYESKSFHGKSARLELLRKDFIGTSQRIKNGTADPINIKHEGTNSDNPYYPIWGSSLTFNFFEETGIGLEQIATDFERDVRLDFYVNGSLYWRGWVMPDLCNDKANRSNAQIKIVASDGLGALSKISLLTSSADSVILAETIGTDISDWNWLKTGLVSKQIDYNYNATIKTLLQVLKVCIDKAELGLGVQIINDLYPIDLPTKDDRQLEYLLVDVLSYQKDGESKNCEEVLKSILSIFECVILQRDGFWFIVRLNYLEGLYVQSEVYDKDFNFLTKKTDNVRTYLRPSSNNDSNEYYFREEGFIRRLRPPYQFQTVEYPYTETLDICPDSLLWRSDIGLDATGWTPTGLTAIKGYNGQTGESVISVTDTNTGSQSTGFYSPKIDVRKLQEIKIQFSLLADVAYLFVKLEATRTTGRGVGTGFIYYWNHIENTWKYGVQPDSDVVFQLKGDRIPYVGQSGGQADSISQYGSQEITLPPCIESGKLTVTLKGGTSKYVTARGNIGLSNTIGYKNFKVDSGIEKEVHSFDIPKTVSFQAENLTVLNGDSLLGLTDKSTILFQSDLIISGRGGDITKKVYKGTSKWKDSSEQESDNILGFLARSIINQFSTRHNIIEGTIRTNQNLKIGALLSFDSYKKFAFDRLLICPPFNYNFKQDTYDLTLFQLSCDIAKGRLSEYWLDNNSNPIYKNIFDYTGSTCVMTFSVESVCVDDNRIFTVTSICDGMANYLSVINENSVQYSNYYWSFLSGFNRLAVEVSDWAKPMLSIPNTGSFGLRVQVPGDYTVFRKNKQNGVVDYVNITANNCSAISTQVLFTTVAGDVNTGFNFKRIVTVTELAGNQLTQFQYGYALIETDEITNWQASPEFNLINEGVYYFDVKVTGKTGTVGKQAVELYLQDITNITGAEESDNPIFGSNTSED